MSRSHSSIFWRNPTDVSNAKKRPFGVESSLVAQAAKQTKLIPVTETRSNASSSIINGMKNPTKPDADANSNLRRPISELESKYRCIFPYISFNLVQSLVFDTMFETNLPVVVSAPTGSGKTGVFELAIIKVLMNYERRPIDIGAIKIIYLAPTKALCSERRDDWHTKFEPFGLQCVEVTSDASAINFKNLNKSSIILATPEKWDSITRGWNGQLTFAQSIRLLLIDEVHLVNDGPRGATLEAVISRMKTIRSMIWPNEPDNLRFIAVSATVSNIGDIADWFSTPGSKAKIYRVDPRERTVKLRTIVVGYKTNANFNEFGFDGLLNHKLADVIKEHSNEKPTLIFCATRKSASNAASVLMKEGKFDLSFSNEKRGFYLRLSSQIRDKTLQETTRLGIAFHHAGLCASDRKLIESGFLDGSVMILCCTSTLAMGVNLPAHLVIIKNTSYYDEGQFKPYSESSLVQMIGRAGRPQFDTEATAIIMTKAFCRDAIEKMLTGKLVVDSQLHKFLTEHLNSEIVLGTIKDDSIARKWIDSTFLRVRVMKNPENYGMKRTSSVAVKENTMISWCLNSISKLLEHKMTRRDKQGQLEATNAGRAMARHYICLNTMVKLIHLKGTESLWDLIQIICSTQEVVGDMQMRVEDRPTLSALCNPNDDRYKFRFAMGDKVNTREQKAAALIQAIFGNITIPENSLLQEAIRIMRNASRVTNCLKDISLMDNKIKYTLLLNILLLSQCFTAGLWENSKYVAKQLERIGPVLSHSLVNNGLTTFESLRRANPRNIEIFCNRLPPFGSNVQQTCFGLPIYELKIKFSEIANMNDKVSLMVEVSLVNGHDIRNQQSLPKTHESTLIVGNTRANKLFFKHQVADVALLARPDLTICYGSDVDKIDLPNVNDDIECHLISEMFVGLNVHQIMKYKGFDCDAI